MSGRFASTALGIGSILVPRLARARANCSSAEPPAALKFEHPIDPTFGKTFRPAVMRTAPPHERNKQDRGYSGESKEPTNDRSLALGRCRGLPH